MDPIGTVTNFYPFLSQETCEIVKSVLKDAMDFDDFVEKLVNLVLAQDETNDFTYFTVMQVWISRNPEIYLKLRPRLVEDVVLRPWSFYLFEGTLEEYQTSFPTSMKQSKETELENWVRVNLLMIGALFSSGIEGPILLNEAKELIEKHSELDYFSPEIHIRNGWIARREGNIEGAIDQFEQAWKIAESHNDFMRKAQAQCDLAGCLKESDIFQALALMEESHQTFRSLGAKTWASVTAANMGLFHTIIGEYDLAVEFYIESNKISKPNKLEKLVTSIVLSHLYCNIDLPEQALEWIKWGIDDEDITPLVLEHIATLDRPAFSLAVARPLIQLGQLEGISQLLSNAHNTVIKLGDDTGLLEYNFVSGLFELATANQDAGFQSMVDALVEAERLKLQVYVNYLLLALAKAELKNLNKFESKGTIESSGLWMTRLGTHAKEKNNPGLRMQHALLKTEYQVLIGESEAAQLTLQDALTFTDSLGVKTLRERILERLKELETSVEA